MYYWQYEKTNYSMTSDYEEAHDALDSNAIASMNTIDFIDYYIWSFDATQTDSGIFCDSNQHQIPCDFMNKVFHNSYSLVAGDGYLEFSILTQDYGESHFIC